MKLAWEAVSGTHACPYLSISVRMDLGTPHGLSVGSVESFGNVEFPTEIYGSRRKWSLGFRKKLTPPDWGRGLRGRRYGSWGRSYGSVRTYRNSYGPPWGPLGAHGGLFPFFPIFGFWPWPRSLKSFRGGPWRAVRAYGTKETWPFCHPQPCEVRC